MAIEVKATINWAQTTFTDMGNGLYEATITAPNHDGEYELVILATNDGGDSIKEIIPIKVSSWIDVKTNWQPTDRFTVSDYERIRNNMISLADLISYEYGTVALEDMAVDGYYTEESSLRWEYEHFNAFEKNLEHFNNVLPTESYGIMQTFYPNGLFIKYDELNRIENLLFLYKRKLENVGAGVRKLPFRLGAFREIRT